MAKTIQEKIDKLTELLSATKLQEEKNVEDAIRGYKAVIGDDIATTTNETLIKLKEQAIYKLGNLYAKLKRAQDLNELNKHIRPFLTDLPKAKTAKIVRTLLDFMGEVPGTLDMQIDFCKESIEWALKEKRTFLRQRIETRLAQLLFEKGNYSQALDIVNKLVKEVRRLDDKALLVEIQLLESRIHHALKNVPKARAALTAARTHANAIYCPPLLQAQLDMQSGILHSEEKDFKTAYSYFYEAFEGFHGLDDPNAVLCLKYMLLCKVMTNDIEDIAKILSGKNALKYNNEQILALKAVALSYQERSLHSFESTLKKYKKEILDDSIISTHVTDLYDNLLEQHLIRIIEPFSRVEIAHVAKLIALPLDKVERKLSQMILDKKLNGILDQGYNCLIVFDEQKPEKLYPAVLETMRNMDEVVDSLFARAQELTK